MFEFVPMTKRVQAMRERYHTTVPKLCTARFRIITDFYEQHPELTGSLRRALMLKTMLEEIPVSVFEDELIVGTQATTYRGSSLNPEFGGIHWFRGLPSECVPAAFPPLKAMRRSSLPCVSAACPLPVPATTA